MMNIKELFQDIEYETISGGASTEIGGIEIDSRLVKPGCLFVATVGRDADGHDYIPQAIESGAAAVLMMNDHVSRAPALREGNVTVISVPDTRIILSALVNTFHNEPSRSFTLIGITGTNGKTSTAALTDHILRNVGHKTGLLGTIENLCGGEAMDVKLTTPTTPDCVELGAIMRRMADAAVDDLIMEVSSMGLKMGRVSACDFDIGVFTNVSPEHLDDHGTMDDYKASKRILMKLAKKAVVNMDDPAAEEFAASAIGPVIRFGIKNRADCDLYAEDIAYSAGGVGFDMKCNKSGLCVDGRFDAKWGKSGLCDGGRADAKWGKSGLCDGGRADAKWGKSDLCDGGRVDAKWGKSDLCDDVSGERQRREALSCRDANTDSGLLTAHIELATPAEFAVYNALAATGAALCAGVRFEDAADALNDPTEIAGRYQVLTSGDGVAAIIDYAHTARALENLLEAVKANPAYTRVVSVFGCGGDRDPSKRAPMGEISGRLADYTIITSDNPRTEEPIAIIAQVEDGIKASGGAYEVAPDRAKAIEKAILASKPGDAVVIAGKGHEDYQIIGKKKIHLDDREIAAKALQQRA
ncbi:MAG: UDP-N-acetylmuramoyl-L-alanyl-D-glutamate--2,6-diaminopimelate ligase [Clostridiales Family XIII bacterium]|jgi:UDP-N-acetylmuramyl tripeptide synthase|nr:UDP-N-acetylmuramoyl-L-alanyl-D-glutamate--2,6-diaminopimelate ligase [Clostridiales Family XIII bacterium]